MNFREILEEKMTAEPATAARPSVESGATDPAHLAFLLGNVRVRRFQARPKARPRTAADAAARPMTKPQPPPTPVRPTRPKGPPHALNERQKGAMTWFQDQGFSLEPDFTADELKTAFRTAARKVHPDCGGTAEEFLALKGHHASLKAVFA